MAQSVVPIGGVFAVQRLRAALPPARLQRYDAACVGTGVDPMDLYRWAGTVALAMFDDLSHVEVAMRSAMADRLASTHGLHWYQRTDLLDTNTLKLIATAWKQGGLSRLQAPPEVLHGKLVASLMFGFWVKLLGRGGFYTSGAGHTAVRERRIYDTLLWKPALRHAFPHVGDLERARVEETARSVQALRNRIAHHEHIVWGVPLPGARTADGTTTRLSVSQTHGALLALAGYVDEDLKSWLRDYSTVENQLRACPLAGRTSLLL